jgi:hypothetical protein
VFIKVKLEFSISSAIWQAAVNLLVFSWLCYLRLPRDTGLFGLRKLATLRPLRLPSAFGCHAGP